MAMVVLQPLALAAMVALAAQVQYRQKPASAAVTVAQVARVALRQRAQQVTVARELSVARVLPAHMRPRCRPLHSVTRVALAALAVMVALRQQVFQARAAMADWAARAAMAAVVSPTSLTPAEKMRGLQVPAAMVALVAFRLRVSPVMAETARQLELRVSRVLRSALQRPVAVAVTAPRVAPEVQVVAALAERTAAAVTVAQARRVPTAVPVVQLREPLRAAGAAPAEMPEERVSAVLRARAARAEPLEMPEFQALAAMVVQAVLASRAVSVSREHRVVPVARAVPRRMARPVTEASEALVARATTEAMLRQVSQLRRVPQAVTAVPVAPEVQRLLEARPVTAVPVAQQAQEGMAVAALQ